MHVLMQNKQATLCIVETHAYTKKHKKLYSIFVSPCPQQYANVEAYAVWRGLPSHHSAGHIHHPFHRFIKESIDKNIRNL